MKKLSGQRVFVGIIICAVTAAVIGGFIVSGSPAEERARRFDAQRVSDLQQITYAIDQYVNLTNASSTLPTNLDELRRQPSVYIPPLQDPKTGIPYEYRVINPMQYELCAIFERAAKEDPRLISKPLFPVGMQNILDHDAGRVCTTIEIHRTNALLGPID